MKIGIIIYSQTGNTLTVARKIEEKLSAAGHKARVEQVTVTGNPSQGPGKFELNETPEIKQYDALIFGSPVHAFSLSPPMAAYLKQLPSLEVKKAACFVTKQLPGSWTGGNRALRKMASICRDKGASLSGSVVVIWSKARRERSIQDAVERISSLF